MPRPSKQSVHKSAGPTLVLDNGAYCLKAGIVPRGTSQSSITSSDCHTVPNTIARGPDGPRSHKVYVADQLETCRDFAEMAFRRPVEKGFVVNWEGQLEIWKQALFRDGAVVNGGKGSGVDPREYNLLVTEAPNCPAQLEANADQIIFEECQFKSAARCVGPSLNAYNLFPGSTQTSTTPAEAIMVIDSGYSHTTIVPTLHGRPVHSAIRRLDIGGKHLTNRLKELISLRQFNLMDDTHLVTEIKEDVCFVSQSFSTDLERCWKGNPKTYDPSIVLDYVLPDYHTSFRGHARPHDPRPSTSRLAPLTAGAPQKKEDAFPLSNERFAVPELLFHPSDISLPQAGLPEAAIAAISSLPQGLWPAMLANILLVGGTAHLPGFADRLESELRALAPAECPVRVRVPDDPVTSTWLGGARLAADEAALKNIVVSREDYAEFGGSWTARRFSEGPRG